VTQNGREQLSGVHEGDVLAGKYRVERVLGAGGMGVVTAPPVAAAPTGPQPAPRSSVAPAPAKCDPPDCFDANGNRMFKRECL